MILTYQYNVGYEHMIMNLKMKRKMYTKKILKSKKTHIRIRL